MLCPRDVRTKDEPKILVMINIIELTVVKCQGLSMDSTLSCKQHFSECKVKVNSGYLIVP